MQGLTATRVPTGTGQSGPVSTTRPAISWPRRNGNEATPASVIDGLLIGVNRWRSLPQMPPVTIATRAQSPAGNAGSSTSTIDAGNAGSA